MNRLLIHPTSTAQWLALLHEAQASSEIKLQEDLESYLVFLLIRFTQQPDIVTSVLGLEFLKGNHSVGQQRQQQLRDVGDKCLLMSGLFPQRAERRRVKLSYFVKLGQAAYFNISQSEQDKLADLFCELSVRFIHLLDVLQAIRALSPNDDHGLGFWQALDMWEETGSLTAKNKLEKLNPDLPFAPGSKSKN